MASALAHPLFRTSNLDREVHSSAGTADLDLGQYHGATNDSRMPSPLPPGPMFLKDISRSSSSSTQSGSLIFHQPNFHTRTPSLSAGRAEEYQRQQQQRAGLPGLTALASLATNHESQMRSFSAGPAPGMMFNQASSVPTPALAANNMLPVCQNCETSTTPLWRRDESGSVLCNACGLFLKLHGRPRPISLKTDVIKSRNRVKSTQQGPKKQMNHQSLPASQSTSAADLLQNGAHRRVSQMGAHLHPEGSHSPISRTGTPSVHHDPNIAPQHMFDGVSLQDHAFQTPALSALEAPLSYDQLLAQTTLLKTRVSELEVINMMFQDNVQNLTKERDDALKAQEELKRRVDELEKDQSAELEHASKRPRLDEPIPEQPNEQAPHAPLEQPVLPESSTTADTTGLGEQ